MYVRPGKVRKSWPTGHSVRGGRDWDTGSMTITANPSVRQVLAQVVQDPGYAKVARKPLVSWPHLGLVALAYGTFVAATWAYLAGSIPFLVMLVLNQAAIYVSFTPLHD